jgi:hypothetical protein
LTGKCGFADLTRPRQHLQEVAWLLQAGGEDGELGALVHVVFQITQYIE